MVAKHRDDPKPPPQMSQLSLTNSWTCHSTPRPTRVTSPSPGRLDSVRLARQNGKAIEQSADCQHRSVSHRYRKRMQLLENQALCCAAWYRVGLCCAAPREPAPREPVTERQCNRGRVHGGWKALAFHRRGDCMAYVASAPLRSRQRCHTTVL